MKRVLQILWLAAAIVAIRDSLLRASIWDLAKSSFTSTGEQQAIINPGRSVLYSVCIDSTSPSNGATFKILNSTASNIPAISTVTIIDTTRTQIGCLSFGAGIFISSGLAYSNGGATPAMINVLWNPYNQ